MTVKLWKDVVVGDIFEDGSVCTAITDWSKKVCYLLEAADGSSITVSDDHLIAGYIIGTDQEKLLPPKTVQNQQELGTDENWIAGVDIHDVIANKMGRVYRSDDVEIVGAALLNDGQPITVRCITCDTGMYPVNGFINHNTGGKETKNVSSHFDDIDAVLRGFKASPVIQDVIDAPDTETARDRMFHGLKQLYADANVKVDDVNIQLVAKKLTSYKRDQHGLRLVHDDEKCDVATMGSIGNKGNLFKYGELNTSYQYVTTPQQQVAKNDAANWLVM